MNFKKTLIPTMMALGVLLVGCGETNNSNNTNAQHEHTYSDLHPAVSSGFLTEGHIAYYECTGCKKLFNDKHEEVTSVNIPKLSKDLVLLIDGKVACDFPMVSKTDTLITFKATFEVLPKGGTISVALKDDTTTTIPFKPFGNNGIITRTMTNATITGQCHCDEEGSEQMSYAISGLLFDDYYIKINGVKHPMPSPQVSSLVYSYGFVDLHKDDKIIVYNEEIDTEYQYDRLVDSAKTNSSILSRGDNNEIVIQKDGKYLIQFKNKEIQVEMVYSPVNTSSVQIDFTSNRDSIALDSVTGNQAEESYEEIKSFINSRAVINPEEIKNALENNGSIFSKTIELRKNEKFTLKDVTNNENISGTNYSLKLNKDIYSDFSFNENEIRVNKSGVYKIVYIPFISQIKIEFVEELVDGFISINNEKTAFVKDITDNCVHSNGLDLHTNDALSFLDKDNNAIDFTLDVSVDQSICFIKDSSAAIKTLLFKKAGNFDVSLDLTTNSVKVIFNSLDGVMPLGNDVSIFVSATRYSMYTTSNNKNELYCTFTYSKNYNISIGVGSGMTSISNELVIDDACKANMSISQGVVRINEGGNITLYLNKFTRRLRYVKN